MFNFFDEDVPNPLVDSDAIVMWLTSVIENERKNQGEINYIFCSDEYLLKVNIEYLKHDYYTDVITFDYNEGDIISGDIFISTDRVKDNSKQYDIDFGLELRRIMVHGLLHLLGYSDTSDEERSNMTKLENKYLAEYK